ncbi:carbon-nitrogen family hydrolase [Neobacillus notoginsengisoli]|uniref:Carbon-nitrogen family hydrolase n=1 Tax=Neobacillus notoginsengisoli TaxID=1578198 RepID=A0A417Z005_9BACI|nr:carbon-nitrogen family hydrolase [Neobacillus notoginsengisoli]RHW43452.1 carbon-nitrogen family hydrolase [Neobacillus notoginsengisoli]
MKIACVQMNVQFGDIEQNFSSVENHVKKAAAEKADTIVFPEMWNTGYALNQLDQLADENGQRARKFLKELAVTFNVNIVGGSVATKKDGSFYNTMYVANRSGEIVAEYDKAHLFKLMDEHLFMKAGQKMNMFELEGIMCGGVICYDLRFPEWIHGHVLKGAKIMFVPAQWPSKRIDHWQILLQARAIENQCFIVAVNNVGSNPNNEFNGHSMVIAPWGELLLSGQTEEGIYYVNVDLQEVDSVRNTIPVFQDRRPDLYTS